MVDLGQRCACVLGLRMFKVCVCVGGGGGEGGW